MISYVTEIDIRKKEVRTIFCKETSTFVYDDKTFPLEEALKVAAEHFARVTLKDWLQKILEHAEYVNSAQFVKDMLEKHGPGHTKGNHDKPTS